MTKTHNPSIERTKLLLTIAPIVAFVVAVAYLQGYWGYFGILIFPYLSFNELLAYAAAPLFGFLASLSLGVLLGTLNALNSDREPSSKLRDAFEVIFFTGFAGVLIYLDRPEKWLLIPIIAIGLSSYHLLDVATVREQVRKSPLHFLVGLIAAILVAGSFGYGRSQAQTVAIAKHQNVLLSIDGKTMKAKFLGKVDRYYFVLNVENKVAQYPESAIKEIVYDNGASAG